MRFFFEVAYKGTRYSGFQVQENANTIQQEVEKVLKVFYKQAIELTGSSRTDAGVHALQNFFQADVEEAIFKPAHVYNLNAMLPPDIVIQKIFEVSTELHCRFHATHRTYHYHIYSRKNPFLNDRAWYYPFPVDLALLNEAASLLMQYEDFTSFSKRNTQTFTNLCKLSESYWTPTEDGFRYTVKGNRFLRGMVRGLVGTMLQVGRGKITLQQFQSIIEALDCTKADFTTPSHGLFLVEVGFKEGVFARE
ncbi:MAG TPA: tRNA pseudouridine(38-40) synthase TruA [Phnomibacter sp.]|nr:tRNA pseudouridine(38-40) synthase TruA [Phnomibacter sp.]